MKNLIPVKSRHLLDEHGITFAQDTLYRWHCQHVHPELFVRIGRSLFIDLAAWNRLVEAAKASTKAHCERLERLGIAEPKQAA